MSSVTRHKHPGQVTIEYFLLFAAVALLTVLGLTRFDVNVQQTVEDFVNAAASKITR